MGAGAPGARGVTTVYLGLGSNLGDRAGLLAAAVAELSGRGIVRGASLSPIYETVADTPDAQPPYLNAVLRGQTELGPEPLLVACLQVEADLGRIRPHGRSKAARTMDIDVLLYGDGGGDVVATPTLTVPHPALLDRPFVLIPLADVATPGLRHPMTGVSLNSAAPSSTVRALVPRGRER